MTSAVAAVVPIISGCVPTVRVVEEMLHMLPPAKGLLADPAWYMNQHHMHENNLAGP